MTNVIFLVEQWAIGIYLILAALVMWQAWRYSRARQAFRSSQFELERDLARTSRNNALSIIVMLFELALITAGIQFVVAPTLRDRMDDQPLSVAGVQEDGDFRTPTPAPVQGSFEVDSSGVQLGEVNPANQILPTPTLTPTFVGTLVPNSPPPVGCDTPNATLQVPGSGMIVFSPMIVRGTAFTDNFSFYKFELSGPSTGGNFAPVPVDGTAPVRELGDLGQFVPAFYVPGEYRFRVVVFDISNTVRAVCEVTIFISEPIPTPTPLATGAP